CRTYRAPDSGSTLLKFVARGADVNAVNKHGETPLHNAVRKNFGNTVKLLLENKAQTNIASTVQDETPLHWAMLTPGSSAVVQLLLEVPHALLHVVIAYFIFVHRMGFRRSSNTQ